MGWNWHIHQRVITQILRTRLMRKSATFGQSEPTICSAEAETIPSIGNEAKP
jgi:hypothetical protein